MSLDRRLSVLPSVMISVRELGTPAPSVAIDGRNDEGGGHSRPGEGSDHPVGGAPAAAQFSQLNHTISTLTENSGY